MTLEMRTRMMVARKRCLNWGIGDRARQGGEGGSRFVDISNFYMYMNAYIGICIYMYIYMYIDSHMNTWNRGVGLARTVQLRHSIVHMNATVFTCTNIFMCMLTYVQGRGREEEEDDDESSEGSDLNGFLVPKGEDGEDGEDEDDGESVLYVLNFLMRTVL